MCTIIAMHGVHPQHPLVVAANRDEFLDRPATGPRLLPAVPPALGGLDLDRGGSWMAASADGFFVGLTNQRPRRPQARALRSRGELVLEALAAGSIAGARGLLAGLRTEHYNAFNLMFGDGRELWVAYARPGVPVELLPLERGVHVLANDRLGSPHFPKAQRARALVDPLQGLPWPELQAGLARVLADHALPQPDRLEPLPAGLLLPPAVARQLQALCIHLPRYGTRSATILALEPGRLQRYLFADGKPCEVGFESAMELLDQSTASQSS
jgi:uncharacterized protein with NRDE domain